MADAGEYRNDGSRLEFPGGALSQLRARAGHAARAAAVHHNQCRPRADRIHPAGMAAGAAVGEPTRHRRERRPYRGRRGRCEAHSAAAHGTGVRRPVMTSNRFGPELTDRGVRFRLWAPQAKQVELVLDKPRPMDAAGGWFSCDVPEARAGTRYQFRIDRELTIA